MSSTRQNARSRLHSTAHGANPEDTSGSGAAPTVLFNGLTREKTFIEDPSPVSEALESLCPEFDSAAAESRYQEVRRYLDRICQEIYYRLHVNNYRILYDTPAVASTAEDLVWGDNERFEILLPIRLPPGYPLRIHPEGGPGMIIRVPVIKQKQPAVPEKDPLDYLRSAKRYLSSAVALKSTWKLVNNAVQQISARYGRDLTTQQVEINKETGAIDVTLTVTSRYLETQLTPPPLPGQPEASAAAAVDPEQSVSFAVPVDDDENSAEEDDEKFSENLTGIAESGAVVYIQSNGRRGKAPPQEVTSRVLHLRLMPVIKYPSDEHAYLTPRPYSFASKALATNPDLWTVQFSMEEALLLQSLARADRGVRLRVWRGLTDFCLEQPELRCVSRDMLKHAIFHLAETEIDLVGIRLQRANLLHYTSDLLASMRDHMHTGSLPHFFYKDVNLMQCLLEHQRRSASLKIDFFLRKDTALVRAIHRTVASRRQDRPEGHLNA